MPTMHDHRSANFCNDLVSYSRRKTREVMVGDVGIGGANPIRLQSMTTTDTMDTMATVEQSIRMIDAGCELVRITAPSRKEAENLANIKKELRNRGYDAPLVADIHFTPNAAEIAARIVEKVRVNPGNYADKKKFDVREYSDAEYDLELERIRDRFIPLVRICKEHGTAMRIGTNHGSLSDRIMNRYGDTPQGMVESALEFARICQDEGYNELVFSMKASNPQVMVQAYRLLVAKMEAEGMDHPLHLGVTEAGEGEDGRIKSAVGIGTLLEDGLGDTVRVSLTEEPEEEIPVARILVERYAERQGHAPIAALSYDLDALPFDPFSYARRNTQKVINIGDHEVPRVMADLSDVENIRLATLFGLGYHYSVPLDKWNLTDQACDLLYLGSNSVDLELPGSLAVVQDHAHLQDRTRHYPLFELGDNALQSAAHADLNFVRCNLPALMAYQSDLPKNVVLVLYSDNQHAMAELRRAFLWLEEKDINVPVILERSYVQDLEHTSIYAATDLGGLFTDGFGDGTFLRSCSVSAAELDRLAFGILQATRTRISKTEYISCPSCGRTLFDLQETTAKIRARTDHLKGIKIGIMGCIVNGPGEMADADYGYVGTGPGKITLYKEKEVVKRNVPSEQAVDELIELIRQHGDWVEPALTV